ncbi:MAG: NUDIX hydrolase [Candidatus Margulisiibacteriota bacterium]
MDGFFEKTIRSERYYDGRVVSLRQDWVSLPDGREARREVVEHKGAVAVVALLAPDQMVLIRQFRKPAEEVIFEIPAGLFHAGEDLAKAAARELKEETGYIAGKIRKVLSAYASPGYSTEILHYFLAEDLTPSSQNLDEDEIVKVECVKISDALKMIKDGVIKDNKTIIGVMIAATPGFGI